MTIAQADKVQMMENDTKKEVFEELKQTHEGILENKPAELDTDGKGGMKRKREEDSSSCVVCMEKEKKVLLLPCKHLCLCEDCSVDVNSCPLCRVLIKQKTTVFL